MHGGSKKRKRKKKIWECREMKENRGGLRRWRKVRRERIKERKGRCVKR